MKPGDSVAEIGCGTGRNFALLNDAVGPHGRVYGVDISKGMIHKARSLRDTNGWRNIELSECDAFDFVAPASLDGVLFSLSYNTMPNHRAVPRKAWEQLRPGGCLVIVDAKVPPGGAGRLILPFSLWLMKRTLRGNPLIHPWMEIAEITDNIEMSECLFGSYYICAATKQPTSDAYELGLMGSKLGTMTCRAIGSGTSPLEERVGTDG